MSFWRIQVRISLIFAVITISCSAAFAGEEQWKPIDPAHLTMKAPIVEQDADAEAIFWDVAIQDEIAGDQVRYTRRNYIRIKIFTERGRESQSTISLPYMNRSEIKDIAARTIKPDGTIIELKQDAIFDQTLIKVSGIKIKAKSFAMPGVEPGSIIEYRWREINRGQFGSYLRLPLQREIPIQLLSYSIKPIRGIPGFRLNMRTYNRPDVRWDYNKDGIYSTSLTHLRAFREEPRMPPEDEVREWVLLNYSLPGMFSIMYWSQVGQGLFEASKSLIKVNDHVRKVAAEITGGASTSRQKLERLYSFSREKIRNLDDDALGMTDIDLGKVKENKNPSDTLKRGMGTGFEINVLFAALAAASGFDARLARLPDRSDSFFKPSYGESYFLKAVSIAVMVDGKWEFFDPSQPYVPFGMLRWQEEGTHAMVADPENAPFVLTPMSAPDKSLEKRVATLRLGEDGTLEGDVRIEYTGHLGADKKEFNDEDSPEQREQTLRESLKAKLSTAEVSNIRIENVTDREKPFVYSYHVRVPEYAQKTGKRLFLQPAFFQRGAASLFSASERKHHIYFHYPWSEEDKVEIELPAGYTLENPGVPSPLEITGVGRYKVSIGISHDKKSLEFKRTFRFCEGGVLLFPPTSYSQLKKVFDLIHERDNHALALRQAGP